jgi:hypothetical protein
MSGKHGGHTDIEEAVSKINKMQPSHFIKDPFVLEFLDVKENEKLADTWPDGPGHGTIPNYHREKVRCKPQKIIL